MGQEQQKGQRWSTFLANHMRVTAACNFFVVPTVSFKMLYAFVVLSHDRRRIVHVGVTAHPTAEWTARQVREAFPATGASRDSCFMTGMASTASGSTTRSARWASPARVRRLLQLESLSSVARRQRA